MSETRIADIIVPEIFYPWIREESLNQNPFFQSGIIFQSPQIVDFLGGGGKTANIPYWKDLTGDADVPSETVADTVTAIATDKMIVIRQIRNKAWGANALSAALAGDNPIEAIKSRVAGFWAKYFQTNLIHCLTGVFADNAADDSSDLIVDISTEDGAAATSANKISATQTIEAIMKQGDHFSDLITIAVHSVTYATMVKNDLIDYVKDSTTNMLIPYYIGLRVIVNDDLPKTAGSTSGYKYTSYLFKRGSVGFGENPGVIVPVELYRNPTVGGGLDELYTRRQFAFAPLGFSWNKSSNTAISPAHSDLYAATSWDRVYNLKNTGVVSIVSNG
jgi:hypothetical protein